MRILLGIYSTPLLGVACCLA